MENNIPILKESSKWIKQSEKINEIDELFNLTVDGVSSDELANFVILVNKESNGKTKLALDFAHYSSSDRIVKWVNASNVDTIMTFYKNLAIELNLFCVPNDYKELRDQLVEKLINNDKFYLFIFDDLRDFKEVKDLILINWPKNIRVLITAKDEDVMKIFHAKKIIKNVFEPEKLESINSKIQDCCKQTDILVLKWLISFKAEFILIEYVKFILNKSNSFKGISIIRDDFDVPLNISLSDAFNSLNECGFADFITLNGKECLKLNNMEILKSCFKNEIELIEEKVAFILNSTFAVGLFDLIKNNHETLHHVITNFVDRFKTERIDISVLLSDLCFKLGVYEKNVTSNFTKEYFYNNKCLELRIQFCPNDEDRICEIKNTIGLYYTDNARIKNDYKIAIGYLKEAYEICLNQLAVKKKLSENILMCCSNLGKAYAELGDLKNARFYFLTALSYMNFSNVANSGIKMLIYTNLSALYLGNDKYELALEFANKSLSIDDNDLFFEYKVRLLSNKANILQKLGKLTEAIECLDSASKLLENKNKNCISYTKEATIKFYLDYALLLEKNGEIEKANEISNKADLIGKSLEFQSEKILKNLRTSHGSDTGDLPSTGKSIKETINSQSILGTKENPIYDLLNQALILRKEKDLSAVVFFYQALELTYKLNKIEVRIKILNKLGQYFLEDLLNFTLSLTYYSDAHDCYLEQFGDGDSLDLAEACLGVAISSSKLKKFEESNKYAEKSLKIFLKNEASNDRNKCLCELYCMMGVNYGELYVNDETKQLDLFSDCLNSLSTLLASYFSEEELKQFELNAIDSVINSSLENKTKVVELKKYFELLNDKIEEKKNIRKLRNVISKQMDINNTITEEDIELVVPTNVTVSNILDKLLYYPMNNDSTGLCLIINNEIEVENLEEIEYKKDVTRLKVLFEKLKFQVKVKQNLESTEIIQELRELHSKIKQNEDKMDSMVLIIRSYSSTYKNEDIILGVDNSYIKLSSILEIFDNVLIGKPKLFIFSFCKKDYKRKYSEWYDETDENNENKKCEEQTNSLQTLIANRQDFFIWQSITENYSSMKLFTESLLKVFKNSVYKNDLFRIFIEVNDLLKLHPNADLSNLYTVATRNFLFKIAIETYRRSS